MTKEWVSCVKNVGMMCRTETSSRYPRTNHDIFGRTASITRRRLALRLSGLLLNENPDGSNNTWCENHQGLTEQGFLYNDDHYRVSRT